LAVFRLFVDIFNFFSRVSEAFIKILEFSGVRNISGVSGALTIYQELLDLFSNFSNVLGFLIFFKNFQELKLIFSGISGILRKYQKF
jgi:hypothetical protein